MQTSNSTMNIKFYMQIIINRCIKLSWNDSLLNIKTYERGGRVNISGYIQQIRGNKINNSISWQSSSKRNKIINNILSSELYFSMLLLQALLVRNINRPVKNLMKQLLLQVNLPCFQYLMTQLQIVELMNNEVERIWKQSRHNWGTPLAFAWRDHGKPQKTSVRTTSVSVNIQIQQLLDASSECYH